MNDRLSCHGAHGMAEKNELAASGMGHWTGFAFTFCLASATLLVLTWPRHFMALVLTTLRRTMQLKNRRHYMHVDGRQKTAFTVLRGRLCLMYVMHLSTMTMLPPLAQMPNRDGGTGMKTMLWDINVIPS